MVDLVVVCLSDAGMPYRYARGFLLGLVGKLLDHVFLVPAVELVNERDLLLLVLRDCGLSVPHCAIVETKTERQVVLVEHLRDEDLIALLEIQDEQLAIQLDAVVYHFQLHHGVHEVKAQDQVQLINNLSDDFLLLLIIEDLALVQLRCFLFRPELGGV